MIPSSSRVAPMPPSPPPARLSPDFTRDREPLPMSRVLRAYLLEAKLETLGALRTAGFALPFIAAPVAIYLFFGVLIVGNAGAKGGYGPGLANYLFAGFAVMAAAMPGIFTGAILATERDGNLLKLKRAMPLPPGATIVAKVLMSMGVAALSVTILVVSALVAGKITLSIGQVAIVWAVLVVGTIPFCSIGLLIGALASGSAAPAWGHLVFLPMMYLSGLFLPLPAGLKRWVVLWPTFHLDQLALGLAGVDEFTFLPPSMAGAVLVGVTVLCGGLAIRRLAREG